MNTVTPTCPESSGPMLLIPSSTTSPAATFTVGPSIRPAIREHASSVVAPGSSIPIEGKK